uniref:PsbP C-terminal domain-containing protein n=1 Tax=Oryza rufipogon TaxID=4529 RepID=A0A0E0PM89_ORYRU
MAPAVLLRLAPSPPYPQNPPPRRRSPASACGASRRDFAIHTAIASASAAVAVSVRPATAAAADEEAPPGEPSQNKKGSPLLGGIANTKSWSQYYGSGFSIRVPPSFDDILEPEEFNVGMTYYGDKAKPRTYAARFASPDRYNRPGHFKGGIKDICGAKLYSARTIKVKDEDDIRTYYFYEFGVDKEHVAVMATVNSGKTYIAGATAPETKWDDDGVKLRSAAVSLSVL